MNPEDRRKHKRVKVPNGTLAACKAPNQESISPVQNIGLGGTYVLVSNPPKTGTEIELIVSLPVGKVRARAVVRHSIAGRGMNLQFIQMHPEDRATLNQFLLQAEGPTEVFPSVDSPPEVDIPTPSSPADQSFEQELLHLTELAHKGTYYQLLEVVPDSSGAEIKHKYHALAKKFHPDLHMDKKQVAGSLKDLMEKITDAYQTLKNEKKRIAYDQKLAVKGTFNLERSKVESQETAEECMNQAQECLRAGNFAGSIAWLRKCAILRPDSSKYHAMLARSLATVHAYNDETILHFEKAIELDPWNTDAYFYFGEFYEALKLPWRAQPLYAKILEINPEHAKARKKLPLTISKERPGRFQPMISRIFGRRHGS